MNRRASVKRSQVVAALLEGNSILATAKAVESAFGRNNIDCLMLVKVYRTDRSDEARYSPVDHLSCRTIPMSGEDIVDLLCISRASAA
jgi:hypothetical protein